MSTYSNKVINETFRFIFDQKGNEYSVLIFGEILQELERLEQFKNLPSTKLIVGTKITLEYFKQHSFKKELNSIVIENPLEHISIEQLLKLITEIQQTLKEKGTIILLSQASEDSEIINQKVIPVRYIRKNLLPYDIIVKRKRITKDLCLIKIVRKRISKIIAEKVIFSIPLEFTDSIYLE